jgi:hypothetical protein
MHIPPAQHCQLPFTFYVYQTRNAFLFYKAIYTFVVVVWLTKGWQQRYMTKHADKVSQQMPFYVKTVPYLSAQKM